ncbi:macro domain-containing protein [Acinetobacter baumannii]|nr:macro domain-containing protein [Acinetobacter baumannii]
MLKYVKGDFFDYDADIRINTVNCVGVMGAGVALLFKNKYPEMFKQYKKDCDNKIISPGNPTVWQEGDMLEKKTYIINFPTKIDWRNKSEYSYVEDGLKWLSVYLSKHKNNVVTLPALGCGHGGLDWNIVKILIEQYLSDSENEILVFEPSSSKKISVNKYSLDADAINLGISMIDKKNYKYPKMLKSFTEKPLFIYNKVKVDDRYDYCVIASSKPDEEEESLIIEKIKNIKNKKLIFGGTSFDQKLAINSMKTSKKIGLFLPSGIHDFILKKSKKFNADQLEVMSLGDPYKVFDKTQFLSATIARISFSKNLLLFSRDIKWLNKKKYIDIISENKIKIYFADYLMESTEDLNFLISLDAKPLSLFEE